MGWNPYCLKSKALVPVRVVIVVDQLISMYTQEQDKQGANDSGNHDDGCLVLRCWKEGMRTMPGLHGDERLIYAWILEPKFP